MAANKKLRLGRGLDGLINNGTSAHHAERTIQDKQEGEVYELLLECIIPNEKQARKNFDPTSIRELANSIQREGLLQPIVVCPLDDKRFSIVAGERRFRAMQLLGTEKTLARIIYANERDCAIISLIENLQRESLNPVEEATGFVQLANEYGFTQEQIAQRVGKARATIANSMRLLNLETEILSHLALGKITVGHAKILLSIDDSSLRIQLLEKILSGDLNIRQTERQANILKSSKPAAMPVTPRELSESLMKIEKQIAQQLAANVSLYHSSTYGKIIIEYKGEQELLRIVQSMGIE
ncbi:MAG: ParB/RepB/Spo0J family partition protein [Puniceicoccales bacterium]|jgi:ParB family chromosome partitioning protein|nr:ParB/RepB/Spo0J family partition protein [Puniceicoccales bacterium]